MSQKDELNPQNKRGLFFKICVNSVERRRLTFSGLGRLIHRPKRNGARTYFSFTCCRWWHFPADHSRGPFDPLSFPIAGTGPAVRSVISVPLPPSHDLRFTLSSIRFHNSVKQFKLKLINRIHSPFNWNSWKKFFNFKWFWLFPFGNWMNENG